MTHRIAILAAALCCALPPAYAQSEKPSVAPTAAKPADKPFALMVGDKAPPITITEWVKGDEVKNFDAGKVYVVEFWATWCGPCVASMPHLSKLQKEYADKGVRIIGVSASDKRNTLDLVKAMVKDKGDGMGYTVAWDADRTTAQAWMGAAGRNGIPCSFVVDKTGRVAYIGHPMELDGPLAEIVAGKFDIERAASNYRTQALAEAAALPLEAALQKAAKAQDWDAAIKATDDLMALGGDNVATSAARKFDILLLRKKDDVAAYAWARTVMTGPAKDDPMLLNQIAWAIVDPDATLANRDVDLAITLATRADELTKGSNAGVLDTLARAHFAKGNIAKAIELQTKAVALDKSLESTLVEYKAALAKRTGG